MTARFLVIVAEDPRRAEQLASAVERREPLRRVLHDGGVLVLVNAAAVQISRPDRRLLVVGTAFTREARPTPLSAEHLPPALDAEGLGRHLTGSAWGSYVSIGSNPSTGTTSIYRDPHGGLSCYYASAPGVILVGSDVAALTSTGAFKPKVDWDYVSWHLMAADLRTEETGFDGLKELMPGTEATVRCGRLIVSTIWTPWSFAVDRRAPPRDEAVEELRSTVRSCTEAWAKRFRHVLLGISGGLDSSILAACVAKSGVRLSTYTLVTEEALGDERSYARPVAEAASVPLHEMGLRMDDVDLGRSSAAHLPRPVGRPLVQAVDGVKRRLEASLGADAVFSGGGGDNVFCSMRDPLPIVDRWLAQGFTPGLLTSIADLSKRTGQTWWATAGSALRTGRAAPASYEWQADARFLAHERPSAGGKALLHPWLEKPSDVLPGKALHVALLLRIQHYVDAGPVGDRASVIHPLLSQPIVELCLRLPTWMWGIGGRDRALARFAFANDLPPVVASRRSKGSPSGFSVRLAA